MYMYIANDNTYVLWKNLPPPKKKNTSNTCTGSGVEPILHGIFHIKNPTFVVVQIYLQPPIRP